MIFLSVLRVHSERGEKYELNFLYDFCIFDNVLLSIFFYTYLFSIIEEYIKHVVCLNVPSLPCLLQYFVDKIR